MKYVIINLFLLISFLSFNTQAYATNNNSIKRIVIEEAENSRVPPALALAVARVESNFNDRALSSAGARGVMQIMPKTAKDVFGVHADELWEPRLNIQLGIDYLEQLYDMYGGHWELALSHYNGGSLNKKGPNATPHSYTRQYVAKVKDWWNNYSQQAHMWRDDKQIQDSYVAARTKPAWNIDDKIQIKEIPEEIEYENRWKNSGTNYNSSMRNREPSSQSFKQRLLEAHQSLDDFTARVKWVDG